MTTNVHSVKTKNGFISYVTKPNISIESYGKINKRPYITYDMRQQLKNLGYSEFLVYNLNYENIIDIIKNKKNRKLYLSQLPKDEAMLLEINEEFTIIVDDEIPDSDMGNYNDDDFSYT